MMTLESNHAICKSVCDSCDSRIPVLKLQTSKINTKWNFVSSSSWLKEIQKGLSLMKIATIFKDPLLAVFVNEFVCDY